MAVSTIDPNGLNIGQIGGTRNLIINGAMQVAQRGTSATFDNSNKGFQTADRFFTGESGSSSAVFAETISTDAPEGFAQSLKFDCTTADTLAVDEAWRVMYLIEGQDLQQLAYGTSSAQSMTLSFYVKCSQTGVGAVWFYLPDDSTKSYTANYTINSADTWERKTLTIPGNTSATINNDTGQGLQIRWTLGAGSNYTSGTANAWVDPFTDAEIAANQTIDISASTSDYWQITGVQLEVGDTATPFEHRSYGQELALCQRYYWRGSSTVQYYSSKYSTGAFLYVDLPVTMRATPTASCVSDSSSGTLDTATYNSQTVLQFYDPSDDTFGVTIPFADAEL